MPRAFPRKRPAQLRIAPAGCGLAALNLWAGPEQDRIRAGQSQMATSPRAPFQRLFGRAWMPTTSTKASAPLKSSGLAV
jgi:hypothetical protein